jgi:UDP-GlcNAc:undecaprenyl-phosphate GlcNAc-1-phosphate transferase
MLWFVAACVLPAFLVSVLVTALMRRCAPRWGLIDKPSARKVHATPTPLGGGLGVYFGFVIPIALAHALAWQFAPRIGEDARATHSSQVSEPSPAETIGRRALGLGESATTSLVTDQFRSLLSGVLDRSEQIWMIIGAGTLLATAGLLDDLRPVSWKLRLVLQFLIAAALVAGGVQATVFVDLPWLGAVLTVLWIVGLVNAMNFLDNMDLLSGGIGLIASVIFAVVMLTLTSEPRWLVGGALLVLAGSLTGFLVHNRPPARIFMGDSGSTFLGLLLACLTVLGTFYDELAAGKHVLLAPLCVLAVPIFDTLSVVWIRLREGRSPVQPDKSHFSHRLVELGLTRVGAVRMVHLCTLTTGLGAVLLYRVAGWDGAAVIVTMVLCVLAIITVLETAGRRNHRTQIVSAPNDSSQSSRMTNSQITNEESSRSSLLDDDSSIVISTGPRKASVSSGPAPPLPRSPGASS